jgi:pimeloyl-ACP methyl ester carboxylesterase
VNDLSADLAALLGHLGIARVGLVGFSMGGWVSTRLALARPDLVGAIAIVDSYERMETPEVAAGYAQIKASLLEHGFNREMIAMLRGFLFGADYDASIWVGKWRARSPHLIAPGYDAMFGRNDINDRLPDIKCPSIVLHGEHNPANGPDVSQELADRLGACEGMTIVPGSGHTSVVERPEFVNETLRSFFSRALA